ncbi:hypothetical protein D7X87_08680 [bacterium D16-54]|nr:hypothetical protein D7X87_08680 [bacterium D16-54]RKJ15191.1 hypothetical protein D7X65_08680 [bacterium D16-56]
MKNDINFINNNIDILNKKVTSIEIHFENVTDKNIQTIAEGHLDLSRKLDDALKVENEKELLVVRVRIIEDELRKMKEQPNQIA